MKDVAVKIVELPEEYNIRVRGVQFNPNGNLLAVRGGDQNILIWDWQQQRIVQKVELLQGANDSWATEPFLFSPDGRLFAVCHGRIAGGIVIRIWDTQTWKVVQDIKDPQSGTGCNAIGFAPDGEYLVRIVSRLPHLPGDTLVVYNTHSWQPVWGMRTVPFYPNTLSISPDGKRIAIGGEVINPKSWPFSFPVPTFGNPPFPDTTLVAIIDTEQHTITRTITSPGVQNDVSKLAWSPDGTRIAAAGGDGMQIFDAQSGELVVNVKPVVVRGRASLRYTPDGKYLIEGVAIGKNDGWGKIWDANYRELFQQLSGNVHSVAVTRDSRYMATGMDGKTIIWELK